MRYKICLIVATYLFAIDIGWANNCTIAESAYFVIDSQAKADELSNCKTYSGRIHVNSGGRESDPNFTISLSGVQKINGLLALGSVASFSAPDLREVSDTLYLRGNVRPATSLNLSLPALETVGGLLEIRTEATQSLSFPSLVRIGSFKLSHALLLKRLSWGPSGFPILMSRDAKVVIEDSDIEDIDWLFDKTVSLGSVEIKSFAISNITIACKKIDELSITGRSIKVTFDMASGYDETGTIEKLSLSGVRQVNYVRAPYAVKELVATQNSFTRLDIPFLITNSLTIRNNPKLINLYYTGEPKTYREREELPPVRSISVENNPALVLDYFTNMQSTNTSQGAWIWPLKPLDSLVMSGSNFSTYFFNGILVNPYPIMDFDVTSDNPKFSCEDMNKRRKGKNGKFPGRYQCQRRDPLYGSAVHLDPRQWKVYGFVSAIVVLTSVL